MKLNNLQISVIVIILGLLVLVFRKGKKQNISDLTPSKLLKVRLSSASVFSILATVWNIYVAPVKSREVIITYIIFGVFAWFLWFFLFHRLCIWLEKRKSVR